MLHHPAIQRRVKLCERIQLLAHWPKLCQFGLAFLQGRQRMLIFQRGLMLLLRGECIGQGRMPCLMLTTLLLKLLAFGGQLFQREILFADLFLDIIH